MRLMIYITAFVSVCSLLGCSSNPMKSNLRHNIDTPTRVGASEIDHYILSDEDVRKNVSKIIGSSQVDFVPANHSTVKLAQKWIDRIDQNLRLKHPNQLASIKKPKLKIVASPISNAMVINVKTCHRIRLYGNAASSGQNVGFVDLNNDGKVRSFGRNETCIYDSDPKSAIAAIEAFNKLNLDCRYSVRGQNITPNQYCASTASGDIHSYNQVAVKRTGNTVVIFTGFFQRFKSEASFVGAIAHELAHYYRRHGNYNSNEKLFYYNQSDADAHRPVANEEATLLGKKLEQATRSVLASEKFSKIRDQKISSLLYLSMGTTAKSLCSNGSCPSSCRQALDLSKQTSYRRVMGRFPFEAGNAQLYLKFEKKILSCMEKIRYSASASLDMIIYRVENSSWVPFNLGLLSGSRKKTLIKSIKLAADFTAPFASSVASSGLNHRRQRFANHADAYLALSKYLEKINRTALDVIKTAKNKKLGQYSHEQEADELALEWILDLGLSANSAVETFLDMGQQEQSNDSLGILGNSVCRRLYRNGWRERSGEDATVAIGNFLTPHHSNCYRAINIHREIEAHRFTQVNSPEDSTRLTMNVSEWRMVQRAANQF